MGETKRDFGLYRKSTGEPLGYYVATSAEGAIAEFEAMCRHRPGLLPKVDRADIEITEEAL